jgi:hypothetical protein
MSLTKAKQFLDGAGVGYRVVAGQGNGDSEAFAKKLIGDKTGTEASYVPHYTALIAVHRGIAVAAKKFDGQGGARVAPTGRVVRDVLDPGRGRV